MDKRRRRRVPAGLALPVSAALLLGACADDDSAGPEAGVTIDELEEIESRVSGLEDRIGVLEGEFAVGEETTDEESEDLPEPIGQVVTVSGEVTALLEDSGFVLSGIEDDDTLRLLGPEAGQGVLVVSAGDATVAEGDVVEVTGTVALFDILEFESALGVDLDNDLYLEHEGQIAIQATTVDPTVPAADES